MEQTRKFVEYYKTASQLLKDFGRTTVGLQFDGKEEACEIYFLMTLKLLVSNSESISHLVKSQDYLENFLILRSMMESFFNLNWVVETKDKNERNDRAFRLEANPHASYEKEINYIWKNFGDGTNFFTREDLKRNLDVIQEHQKNYPLLTVYKNGEISYKTTPNFASKMGPQMRKQYYHFYVQLSAFTHPSSFLKSFLLKDSRINESPTKLLLKYLDQFLFLGLLFVQLSIGYCVEIFDNYFNEKSPIRLELYKKSEKLVDEANNGVMVNTPKIF